MSPVSTRRAHRAVCEYLDALDEAAFGATSEVDPRFTFHSDAASQWIAARKGPAFFSCSDNYLIDTDHRVKLKRPGKTGQSAKVYPTLKNGYEDDDETEVITWKRQAIDGLTGVFSDKVRKVENNEAEVKELHAMIRMLAVENDFLSHGLKSG